MQLEANKALVRRMFEQDLNTNDREAGEAFFAPDFYDHTNPPDMRQGIEGHKAIVRYFRSAFPDVRWEITEAIAEEDKVVVSVHWTGTHLGDFFGIAPTGKQVSVKGIHILRVADGHIAEHWGQDDDLGLMRQLGVIPTGVES
jgi:steroid delta-isomerase-like uncharacterized protein